MGDVNRGFQAQPSVALNLVKQQSCSRSCSSSSSSSSSTPLIRIVHVVSHKARCHVENDSECAAFLTYWKSVIWTSTCEGVAAPFGAWHVCCQFVELLFYWLSQISRSFDNPVVRRSKTDTKLLIRSTCRGRAYEWLRFVKVNTTKIVFIPLWPLCCSVFLKAEQIQLVKKQSSSSSSPPPPLFAIFPYKCRLFGNSFDSSERSLSILSLAFFTYLATIR
ncbi:hypothetical protein T07_5336 [Trichinella nelsoni]|uniref:Uncharacterized protein n=1 Tax=Trichinella nelsoni TaxID=6336 RepID=A0A0V0RX44_9BILA|nr:hypothetical protein T07_5336 [Trichinella nelsoni]